MLIGIFARLCLLTAQLHQFVSIKQVVFDEPDGSMHGDVYLRLKALLRDNVDPRGARTK